MNKKELREFIKRQKVRHWKITEMNSPSETKWTLEFYIPNEKNKGEI